MLSEKWVSKKSDKVAGDKGKTKTVPWKGPEQYTDEKTKSLMMLPSDLALLEDAEFKKWVEIYAKDEDKFFEDFSRAFEKLLHLGVSERVSSAKPLILS